MPEHTLLKRLFKKSSKAMRAFLLNSTLFIMLGVWLTGFEHVHWAIYIVPTFYTFAFGFGICPGINLWRMITKHHQTGETP